MADQYAVLGRNHFWEAELGVHHNPWSALNDQSEDPNRSRTGYGRRADGSMSWLPIAIAAAVIVALIMMFMPSRDTTGPRTTETMPSANRPVSTPPSSPPANAPNPTTPAPTPAAPQK